MSQIESEPHLDEEDRGDPADSLDPQQNSGSVATKTRLASVLMLLVMVYVATLLPNTPAELGLALVTGSVLLATPQLISSPFAQATKQKRRGFADNYLRALTALAFVGVLLAVAGVGAGHLHSYNLSSGRLILLIGVAVLEAVLLGLIPWWIFRILRDVLSDEMRNRLRDLRSRFAAWLAEADENGWFLLLGSLCFISGTILQFIATA